MTNEQKQPAIFLYIGEFDMTFPSTSPEAYIERLQNKERLQEKRFAMSRHLRLLPASDNDIAGFTSHATFALQQSTRGASVWGVGTIYMDNSGNSRIAGKIGIDNRYLFFEIISIVAATFILLVLESPIKISSITVILVCIGLILTILSLKRDILNYLREPNTSAQN